LAALVGGGDLFLGICGFAGADGFLLFCEGGGD
jgi:hypothetical protein